MRQDLKDRYGHLLGYTDDRGNRRDIFDRYGHLLGYYDGRYTYDRYGHKVGEGDLLAALLPRFDV